MVRRRLWRARGVDPDTRETFQPAGIGEAEAGQGVDDQLFDLVDIGRSRARPRLDRQDRVPDELARPVVSDVAATVHPEQFGPDACRVDQHVLGVGPDPRRVDMGVLQEQQPVVSAGTGGP
jgi:hypothetical protein